LGWGWVAGGVFVEVSAEAVSAADFVELHENVPRPNNTLAIAGNAMLIPFFINSPSATFVQIYEDLQPLDEGQFEFS
jgi:hypothetical protein